MSNEQGGQLLDAVLTSVVAGASHTDATVRRTCLQILTRLTSDWCGGTNSAKSNGMESSSSAGATQEAVAGFQRYAIDVIVSEACILPMFGGPSSSPAAPALTSPTYLDPKDAATNAVLGEVAALLKLVATLCCSGGGGELGSHMLATSLPKTGLPTEIQHQIAICLRDFEAKELKEALKAGLFWKIQNASNASSRMS